MYDYCENHAGNGDGKDSQILMLMVAMPKMTMLMIAMFCCWRSWQSLHCLYADGAYDAGKYDGNDDGGRDDIMLVMLVIVILLLVNRVGNVAHLILRVGTSMMVAWTPTMIA